MARTKAPSPTMPNPIVMNLMTEGEPLLRLGMIGLYRLFTNMDQTYHNDRDRYVYPVVRDLFLTGRLRLEYVDDQGQVSDKAQGSTVEMRLYWSDPHALNELGAHCHGEFDNADVLGFVDKDGQVLPGGIAIWPGFVTDPKSDRFTLTLRMHQAFVS